MPITTFIKTQLKSRVTAIPTHSSRSRPFFLGVNPWIYDFAAHNFWARPIGLLACLDMLRSAGADVGLLDCMSPPGSGVCWPRQRRFGTGHYPKSLLPKPSAIRDVPRNWGRYGLPMEGVRNWLNQATPPDAVLVTCAMTYWYPGVTAMIHLLRQVWPKTPIVLGGAYATLCPAHAAGLEADLVVSGPLEEPRNWERLWRLAGQSAPSLPRFAGLGLALDLYPHPGFSVLLGSRGCPFACSYCASNQLYRGFSRKTPEDLCAELEREVLRGVQDFAFYDDALLVDGQNWLESWMDLLASRGIRPRLHTPNALHVSLLTPEVCKGMRRAGFMTIRLGLETASAVRLDAKLSPGHWESAVIALHSAGFQPEQLGAYILFGLPGQDLAEVAASVRTARSCGVRPIPTAYSPLPGTQLFAQAVAASDFPLAEEPLFHNPSLWPCMPGGFSRRAQGVFQELCGLPG